MRHTISKVYVYKVTSPSNKCYIGITNNWYKRWSDHIHNSKTPDYIFHKAINKYSPENMLWEIIDTAETYEKAYNLERYYINANDSYKNGYNSTIGGDGVAKWTKDKLKKEALKYKTKIEFKQNNQSAYVILNSYKKIDLLFYKECTLHFIKKNKPYKSKWTIDVIKDAVSNYKTLKGIRINNMPLYAALGRLRRSKYDLYRDIVLSLSI